MSEIKWQTISHQQDINLNGQDSEQVAFFDMTPQIVGGTNRYNRIGNRIRTKRYTWNGRLFLQAVNNTQIKQCFRLIVVQPIEEVAITDETLGEIFDAPSNPYMSTINSNNFVTKWDKRYSISPYNFNSLWQGAERQFINIHKSWPYVRNYEYKNGTDTFPNSVTKRLLFIMVTDFIKENDAILQLDYFGRVSFYDM